MISIDWTTKTIFVPKEDMTLLEGDSGEVRELDMYQFHVDLAQIEASEDGICFKDSHSHVTSKTTGGIVIPRVIDIVNDYTITFEDGPYSVRMTGSVGNYLEKVNENQVSVEASVIGADDIIGSKASDLGLSLDELKLQAIYLTNNRRVLSFVVTT